MSFRESVEDVQGDVAELVSGPESMSSADGHSVDVPFDSHFRIVDGFQAAFQVGVVSFLHVLQILERSGENGPLQLLFRLLLGRPAVILQLSDFLQSLLVQGVQAESGFALDGHGANDDGLAQGVDGRAHVRAGILGVSVTNPKS